MGRPRGTVTARLSEGEGEDEVVLLQWRGRFRNKALVHAIAKLGRTRKAPTSWKGLI